MGRRGTCCGGSWGAGGLFAARTVPCGSWSRTVANSQAQSSWPWLVLPCITGTLGQTSPPGQRERSPSSGLTPQHKAIAQLMSHGVLTRFNRGACRCSAGAHTCIHQPPMRARPAAHTALLSPCGPGGAAAPRPLHCRGEGHRGSQAQPAGQQHLPLPHRHLRRGGSSSTSNMRVALGGITPPAPRAPYASSAAGLGSRLAVLWLALSAASAVRQPCCGGGGGGCSRPRVAALRRARPWASGICQHWLPSGSAKRHSGGTRASRQADKSRRGGGRQRTRRDDKAPLSSLLERGQVGAITEDAQVPSLNHVAHPHLHKGGKGGGVQQRTGARPPCARGVLQR